MNTDDITYHSAPEDEVPEAAPDLVAKVNLFDRLSELRKAPPAPLPAASTAPTDPHADATPPPAATETSSVGQDDPSHQRRLAKRLLAVAAALLLLVGAGGVYAYQTGRQPELAQKPGPSAAPGKQPARSPSARPSARPSSKPSPPARPAPTPVKPPAAPGTYVVQPGDTLITIGDKLKKDWRSIAAANNVPNPNFITPGQVLRIP